MVNRGIRGVLEKMKKILITAIILTVLLIAGCSSNTSNIKSVEEDSIKIGFIGPMSGSQAIYGQWGQKGIEFAAKNKNNVKLFIEDSVCDPKKGISAYTTLADIYEVDAIISSDCSSPTLAYIKLAQEAKIPLIVTTAAAPAVSEAGDFIFRIRHAGVDEGKTLARFAEKNKWNSVAILHQETDAGVSYADEFSKSFTGKIAPRESYLLDSKDFRIQLSKIKASNPDALLIFTQGDLGSIILKQIKELGVKVPIISSGTNFPPSALEAAGNSGNGIYASFPEYNTGEYEPSSEFKREFSELNGEEPSYLTAVGYDALNLFYDAFSECENKGRGNEGRNTENKKGCVREKISKTNNYPGVSSKISLDEKGELKDVVLGMKISKDGDWINTGGN